MIDILIKRRSIRKYKQQEVEEEKVQKLINAALLSPTSKNKYSWEFVVVRDKETLEKLSKAREMGTQILVFGSGPAKNIPEGFPFQKGYEQIVNLLREISRPARECGITIVIEPLRKEECNIINTFEEGWHDWSPDGKWLVGDVYDKETGRYDIYLMNYKTKQIKILTSKNQFKYNQAPVFLIK